MKVKFLTLVALTAPLVFLSACTSTPQPNKNSLSVQPHNMPASWEGSAGMGAMMGSQYQD